VRAAPAIANGRVYVVGIDNELQALDERNGEVLWHHRGIAESATLMGASSPAVTPDGVIVAYSSGEIYDLRPENGRSAWNYTLTVPTQVGAMPAIADIRGLPVVDQDRVYAISQSGRRAIAHGKPISAASIRRWWRAMPCSCLATICASWRWRAIAGGSCGSRICRNTSIRRIRIPAR
jgi:outer membrane protein assembly factor BamB